MRARSTLQMPVREIRRRSFVRSIGALVVALIADCANDSPAHADDAGDFRVIVHPENPSRSVERRFLGDAFLKEVSRWDDGAAIHPVDLRADSPTRAKFSDRIVQRSVAAVKNYWQQRIFSGRGL